MTTIANAAQDRGILASQALQTWSESAMYIGQLSIPHHQMRILACVS
jgi:hypothetical protein